MFFPSDPSTQHQHDPAALQPFSRQQDLQATCWYLRREATAIKWLKSLIYQQKQLVVHSSCGCRWHYPSSITWCVLVWGCGLPYEVESFLVLFDAFCEHPRHSAAERVCPLARLPYEIADQRRFLLENKKCQGEATQTVVLPLFPHAVLTKSCDHTALGMQYLYTWVVF